MTYKKVYDIKKVNANIGIDADAFPVEGLVSLSASRDEDEYTSYAAADGLSARNVKNNKATGKMNLTIANGSPTHKKIMLLRQLGVQFPIVFVDKSSDSTAPAVAFGDGCVLMKLPDWERSAEEGETEYIFTCTDLQINHAGAGDA